MSDPMEVEASPLEPKAASVQQAEETPLTKENTPETETPAKEEGVPEPKPDPEAEVEAEGEPEAEPEPEEEAALPRGAQYFTRPPSAFLDAVRSKAQPLCLSVFPPSLPRHDAFCIVLQQGLARTLLPHM